MYGTKKSKNGKGPSMTARADTNIFGSEGGYGAIGLSAIALTYYALGVIKLFRISSVVRFL